jgi:hypothetical protein
MDSHPPGGGDVRRPNVRVVGVNEHFNLPFFSAVRDGAFQLAGLNVTFTTVPGGTGAMLSAVTQGDADVAVALTEGIVAGVCKANAARADPAVVPLRYCGEYVAAPLCWMIATGAENAQLFNLQDLRALAERPSTPGVRVAISRMGSGSHLMSFILALQEGLPLGRLTFHLHHDFRQMRRAVVSGDCDFFMWENFMTKPFVDSGELRAVGTLNTPWNCFGFVAREAWLANATNRAALRVLASTVFEACARFLAEEDASCESIAAHFGLRLEDAHAWMASVAYPPPAPGFGQLPEVLPASTGGTAGTAADGVCEAASPLRVSADSVSRICSMLQRVGVLAPDQVLPLREIVDLRVASVQGETADAAHRMSSSAKRLSVRSRAGSGVGPAASADSPTRAAAAALAGAAADIFTPHLFAGPSGMGLKAAHSVVARSRVGSAASAASFRRFGAASADGAGSAGGRGAFPALSLRRRAGSEEDDGDLGAEAVHSLTPADLSPAAEPPAPRWHVNAGAEAAGEPAAVRHLAKSAALQQVLSYLSAYGGASVAARHCPAVAVVKADSCLVAPAAHASPPGSEEGLADPAASAAREPAGARPSPYNPLALHSPEPDVKAAVIAAGKPAPLPSSVSFSARLPLHARAADAGGAPLSKAESTLERPSAVAAVSAAAAAKRSGAGPASGAGGHRLTMPSGSMAKWEGALYDIG